MVTLPYKGVTNNLELCEAIAFENERPPMPIECPTKLKSLIRACWDPEPSNRPSFKEMLEGNVSNTHGRHH
jgi:hypothetical protein